MAKHFAAVDIGSNAIRLIICRMEDGHIHSIKKFREPIRLGGDVFSTGEISENSLQKVVHVFDQFKEEFKKFNVEKVRAVATSAMRDAKNNQTLIKKVWEKTGIKIEIISGQEEAQLIQKAITKHIDLTHHNALLIDIGGGSLELTITKKGKARATKSFQLGTVRVLEKLKSLNLDEQSTGLVLSESLPSIISFLAQERDYEVAIGTGGNLESLGNLKQLILKKDSKTLITQEEVDQILSHLKKTSIPERMQKWKLREDRADVIYVAVYIISVILRQAEIKKLALPYVGLREGIIFALSE